MKEEIQKFRKDLGGYLAKMSSREWAVIFFGASLLFVLIAIEIVSQIDAFFDEQTLRLTQVEERLGQTTNSLQKYLDLRARRDQIESNYREVAVQEDVLSHLENLIKNKAGIQQGLFTIRDSPPNPFGGNYEQLPMSVKFTTTNLQALVDFLREVSEGPKPLILSRLDLNRRRGADRLDVEISLSSIRRK